VIADETRKFLELVSRLETVERSLKENEQLQGPIQEDLVRVEGLRREILSWLDRHKVEEFLAADIDALNADFARLHRLAEEIEGFQPQRRQAEEMEREAAKRLQKTERALLKVRRKVDAVILRKENRDRTMADLLGNVGFSAARTAIKEEKKRFARCKELAGIAVQARELGYSSDMAAEQERLQAEQESADEALARAQAALDELEGQIRWRDLVRRLSAERAGLEAGAPCPLCGSKDHPFVDLEEPDFTELDHMESERRERVESLLSRLETLRSEAEGIRTRSGEIQSLAERWERLCSEAGVDWSMADGDAVVQQVHTMGAELKRRCTNLRTARLLRWRNAWLNWSLHRKLERLRKYEARRDEARQGHEHRLRGLHDIDEAVGRLRREEETVRGGIVERLEPYGETAPALGAEAELIQRLTVRQENYSRQREELERLGAELQQLESRREKLPQEYRDLLEESRSLSPEIESLQARLTALKAERETLYGSMDPEAERNDLESRIDRLSEERGRLKEEKEVLENLVQEGKRSLPQWNDEVDRLESACLDVETALQEEMAAAGYATISEVRAHLSILDDSQTILDRVAAAERKLAAAKARAEEARDSLEALPPEPTVEISLETLIAQMDEEEERHASLENRWEEAERRLAEYRDADREHREILAGVAVQEELLDELRKEQQLLRMRDAAEIQLKRQRLMLTRLVDQANGHLAGLSGRYLLRTVETDGLGLEVEDSLQGRARRSLKTLSGGESFVVSLCLALGLSEMAARHRKIESLFLDEGFGTLDEEMLYKVLAALKNLRANGKMVGIISHVKRLADEIPTQIRVNRIADGSSVISIAA